MSSIASQLKTLRSEFAAWIQDFHGRAEVAGDPVHLFAMLANKPGGVHACILFVSEIKRGEYEEAGGVDRTYWVIISRGQGFTLAGKDSLVTGNAGKAPLFDLVEQAREVIRQTQFDVTDTEVTPNFLAIRPFQLPTEKPVDAYQIEFSIFVQLGAAGSMLPGTVRITEEGDVRITEEGAVRVTEDNAATIGN